MNWSSRDVEDALLAARREQAEPRARSLTLMSGSMPKSGSFGSERHREVGQRKDAAAARRGRAARLPTSRIGGAALRATASRVSVRGVGHERQPVGAARVGEERRRPAGRSSSSGTPHGVRCGSGRRERARCRSRAGTRRGSSIVAQVSTVESTSERTPGSAACAGCVPDFAASRTPRPGSRRVSSAVCWAANAGNESYLNGMYSGRTSSPARLFEVGDRADAGHDLARRTAKGETPIIGEKRRMRSGRGERGVVDRRGVEAVLDGERAAVRVAGDDEGLPGPDALAHVPGAQRGRPRASPPTSRRRARRARCRGPGIRRTERVVAEAPQDLGVGLDAVRGVGQAVDEQGAARGSRPRGRARRCGSSSSRTAPG